MCTIEQLPSLNWQVISVAHFSVKVFRSTFPLFEWWYDLWNGVRLCREYSGNQANKHSVNSSLYLLPPSLTNVASNSAISNSFRRESKVETVYFAFLLEIIHLKLIDKRVSVAFALQIIHQNSTNMSRKDKSKSKKLLEYLHTQENEIVDSLQTKIGELDSMEPLNPKHIFKS